MKDALRIAEIHHGITTSADLAAAGVTIEQLKRRRRAGELVTMHRNVHRIGGAPMTARQTLMAAVAAGGKTAVASHRSAGDLWGLYSIRCVGTDNVGVAP